MEIKKKWGKICIIKQNLMLENYKKDLEVTQTETKMKKPKNSIFG